MFSLPALVRLAALSSAFLLPSGQSLPTHTEPMRNTFVVAAESVIDAASAVDLHAQDAVYRTQMQQTLTVRDNLNRMAEDDRERDIATATGDLIFAVQACRIQASGGGDVSKCQAQVTAARTRAMDALGKHKRDGTWVDGPPAR